MTPTVTFQQSSQHGQPGAVILLAVFLDGAPNPGAITGGLLFSPAALKLVNMISPRNLTLTVDPDSFSGGIVAFSLAAANNLSPHQLLLQLQFSILASGGTTLDVKIDQVALSSIPLPSPLTASTRIYVQGAPFSLASTSLPAGVTGVPYRAVMPASGGFPPYTWTIPSLPLGLRVYGNLILGTPYAAGPQGFEATVADSDDPPASTDTWIDFSATAGPLTITPSLSDAYVGQEIGSSLLVLGGIAPYTWTVTGGTPPAGLTIGGDGSISGTPVTVGTSQLAVTVTDSTGNTTSGNVSLRIRAFSADVTLGTITGARALLAVPNAVPQPYELELDFVFSPNASGQQVTAAAIQIAFDEQIVFRDVIPANSTLRIPGLQLVGGPREIQISRLYIAPADAHISLTKLVLSAGADHDRAPGTVTHTYSPAGNEITAAEPIFLAMTLPGSGDDLAVMSSQHIEFLALRADGTVGRRLAYSLPDSKMLLARRPGTGIRHRLAALSMDGTKLYDLSQVSDGAWLMQLVPLNVAADCVAFAEPAAMLVGANGAVTRYAPDGTTNVMQLPAVASHDPIASIVSVPVPTTQPLPDAIYTLSPNLGQANAFNTGNPNPVLQTIGHGASAMAAFAWDDIYSLAGAIFVSDPQHGQVCRFSAVEGSPFSSPQRVDGIRADHVVIAAFGHGAEPGVVAFSESDGMLAAIPAFTSNALDMTSTGGALAGTTVTRGLLGQVVAHTLRTDGELHAWRTPGQQPAIVVGVSPGPPVTTSPEAYVETAVHILVGNQGGRPLQVTSLRIDGDLRFAASQCPRTPFTINAGDATPIDIAFCGDYAGTYYGRVTLWCDDPLTPAVSLPVEVNVASGSAVVSAQPNHITFYASPGIFVNDPALTRTWVIEASGSPGGAFRGGTLQSLTVVGTDADLVTAAKVGSPTAPFTQCVIDITLNPARVGQLEAVVVAAVLDLNTIHQVAVSIRANVQPALQAAIFMLPTLNCGDGRDGHTVVKNFDIINVGPIDLVIGAANISGPDATAFVFQTPLPLTIPIGQSANISIAFSPSSDGEKSAMLSLTSNAPATTAQLIGFGDSPLMGVTPQTASFTSYYPQHVATTVYNFGSLPFVISVDVTGPFSVVAPTLPATISVGTSTDISVLAQTQPSGSGDVSGSLTIRADDPTISPVLVTLNATW